MSSGGRSSDKQPSQNDSATKPCRVCGEEIRFVARKCVHCGSWQTWHEDVLGLSTTTLSLLVALVSVATAGIPLIVAALKPQGAKISATVETVSYPYVSAFVSNSGSKPGLLTLGTTMHIDRKNGEERIAGLYLLGPSEMVIAPGSSSLLRFAWRTPQLYSDTEDAHCDLAIPFTDFDGTDTGIVATFNCNKLPPTPPALDHGAIWRGPSNSATSQSKSGH